MFKNYLVVAIRILLRQKTYSFINIFGLAIGVASAILIMLYVKDELSYDRFHRKPDETYRITFAGRVKDQNIITARTGMPLAEGLQRNATGVEAVTRLEKWITCPVRYEEKAFTEMYFCLADSNFFRFFNYELIVGNPDEVLTGPNRIVISETAATRYFGYKGNGDRSPIGKTLVIGSEGAITAEVSGIAKDPSLNSHFRFDFLMSLPTSGYPKNSWLDRNVYTYVRLTDNSYRTSLERTLGFIIDNYGMPEIERGLNVSRQEFKRQGGEIAFKLQSLSDIHLRSSLPDEFEPNGNIQYVYMLGMIALFILALACVNFMNLATARSASRAKEIGVRKAIGALRSKLIRQFIGESFVYVAIAFLVAIGLVCIAIPFFNDISGKLLSPSALLDPFFITAITAVVNFAGLLAGAYPAFYLTAFKPVEVLKGVRSGRHRSHFRNGLVVFQFAVSIALIISALIVHSQLTYLQERNLGFDKENVVGIMHTMSLGKDARAFKTELLRHPEFLSATYANILPPGGTYEGIFNKGTGQENYSILISEVDSDYLKTLGLQLAQGRFFEQERLSDTTYSVVLNESAAKMMGITDIDGEQIRYAGDKSGRMYNVVGIVKDYNFESLRTAIRPLLMFPEEEGNWGMGIRLAPGNPTEKIKVLEQLWKQFAPHLPFEYAFVDENFNSKFQSERKLGKVIVSFTTIAMFIAALGLFGLSTYTAEQRSKEISIRKVLGASARSILYLLSRDFVKLVLLAIIIAIPLTWLVMDEWLKTFAYRVGFSFTTASLAGIIALSVALLTVSFQTFKAALLNPVRGLRSE